ncbi:MAG: glycosyltransferase family 9 protein [Planctomycetes bacterium]|nr:glycosyltransferase family 9 protein [Planctomycetota bacterium]NOG53935.1 glycosyltransferase family 9 protein [Planctomycetota bacterium]
MMMMAESAPASIPQRLCLVRPSALGDVCRTVPILVSLRRAFPEAHIDWLVQDSFAPAIQAHPDLSGIIPFPRAHFGKFGRSWQATTDFVDWAADLRRRQYDLVLDCQGLARSALFTWCTRAPRRVGYARAREFASAAYTHRHPCDLSLHTVDQMLSLLEHEGLTVCRDMQLYTRPEDSQWWEAEAAKHAIQGDRYAVFAPTSRWPAKRWPEDRFRSLIDPVLDRGFSHIVIVGTQAERSQCVSLLEAAGRDVVVDLMGQTDVGKLMAVLARAGLVIANDSAALHMAIGFNRRFIALYGPTNIEAVGPYPLEITQPWVIQHVQVGEPLNHKDTSPGAARMMERITLQEVIGVLDNLLAENPPDCP